MRKPLLYIMALGYFAAGLNHFRAPEMYMPMMPPYLPAHGLLIFLSGIAEAGLGLLLLPEKTRRLAAWGIIALLIAVFPANVYMYQTGGAGFGNLPEWLLIARLPLQLILIAWAYWYTRETSSLQNTETKPPGKS